MFLSGVKPVQWTKTDTLDNLECIDQLWECGRQILVASNDCLNKDNVDLWLTEALHLLQQHTQFSTTQERFIYAPITMYALDLQSTNTPEKQRLRAQGVSVHQGMAILLEPKPVKLTLCL